MSDASLRHKLPYIMPAQAMKYLTHNTAIEQIDVLQSLCLHGLGLQEPPLNPALGACYDIGSNPLGDFIHAPNKIGAYLESGWHFFDKVEGMTAYVREREALHYYDGASWVLVSGRTENFEKIGINTTADNINKLAVKSKSVLFSADDQSNDSSGDLRLNLNKSDDFNVVSLIYQVDNVAHAEAGMIGDNNYQIKVGPSTESLRTALEIDADTGNVGLGKSPSYALDVVKSSESIAGISMTNLSEAPLSGASIRLNSGHQNTLNILQYSSNTAYMVSSSSTLYYQLTGANPTHRFFAGVSEVMHMSEIKISMSAPTQLFRCNQNELPSAITSGQGALIYLLDGEGGGGVICSDGTVWRYVKNDSILV